jgi:hypothetical protein
LSLFCCSICSQCLRLSCDKWKWPHIIRQQFTWPSAPLCIHHSVCTHNLFLVLNLRFSQACFTIWCHAMSHCVVWFMAVWLPNCTASNPRITSCFWYCFSP